MPYRLDPHAPVAHATGLIVLTLAGERIAAIARSLDAGELSRFGLPRLMAADPPAARRLMAADPPR
jgi:RNA polymerase sigma-70 factor (ECF subfamily)